MHVPPADSIARSLQPNPHDPLDQLRILRSPLPRRQREVLVRGEDRIWIRLDKKNFALRSEAEVDPRVPVDRQQVVYAPAGPPDVTDDRRGQSFGELVFESPAFAVIRIPLRAECGDLRLIGRDFAKDEFPYWKNNRPPAAETTERP